MTLAQLLDRIFHKRKKNNTPVAPTPPPVVVTAPIPTETTEDLNDYNYQLNMFMLRAKQLGVQNQTYGDGIKDLDNSFKSISNPTQEQIIEDKQTRDMFSQRYQTEGALSVRDLRYRAKNLVNIFNKETDLIKKKKYASDYLPLRADLNSNFDNFLASPEYAMTFKQDITKPIETAPQTGTTIQIGENVQTNNPQPTTPTIPHNDGTYPNWVNKDYSPNTTVYYNGHLYNSIIDIYGTNNNAPDRDGRWKLIL